MVETIGTIVSSPWRFAPAGLGLFCSPPYPLHLSQHLATIEASYIFAK